MKKHWKKIIPLVLIVTLVVSTILILLPGDDDHGQMTLPMGGLETHAVDYVFSPREDFMVTREGVEHLSVQEALERGTPREGYILAPTLFGFTGIDTISSFVLQTPGGYNIDFPAISIDGQLEPHITRYDINTFIVTPAIPLTSNQVYIFRLAREESQDITWAFQVAPQFEIISTLPAHQSTNVPVRTGIEVTFSMGENIDISNYFSIYPHVEGRFITRDSTSIFMPTDPLAEGQIYTVTIAPGIHLPNTSEMITTAYGFSFETTLDGAPSGGDSRVFFSSPMVEFPTFAQPSVNYWLNYNRDGRRPSIEMEIYQFEDVFAATHAYNQLIGVPSWSNFSPIERMVDTSGLTRISTTTVTERQRDSDWDETFTLPSTLPPGFYLLQASTDTGVSQMLIQITDIAVQLVADDDRVLLWINDMTTGQPIRGATVYDPGSTSTFQSNEHGIVVADGALSVGGYLIIVTEEGKESVIFAGGQGIMPSPRIMVSEPWGGDWGWGTPSGNNDYWTALQLDRTLFQRSDTLSFWGFVQNRRVEEEVSHVTAVLSEHSWWHSPQRDTLHRQNVPVRYGAYSGEVNLPHLEPGSYQLAIYHGDIRLSSTFFTIMDYVTPPYRLTVTSSQNAVFAGEEVTFTARTEFFEGTPVPDLELSYSIWGWELGGDSRGSAYTNEEGEVEITATPIPENNSVQGERWLEFSAEATLPEMGWTHQWTNLRVFVNDIHMRGDASREGEEANLTVDLHTIILDRLNDGTYDSWSDFLDQPIQGQRISVDIQEIYWEPIREGERYCHITRQVIPRYRYERRERVVESFEMTTDEEGNATREFQVPDRERASYQARLTTIDGNGRQMVQYVFIGRDFSWFFWNAGDDGLFLDGVNEEGYSVGDTVELTIMQGTEGVTQGNFLFVVVQNGILSYHLGVNPFVFEFEEKHVPNVQVYAFHFNGHTYQSGWNMSQRLRFHDPNRELEIAVTKDQETYRPGDWVEITVTTTDKGGNPKAANVNVSLVDEALFALMDMEIDTFQMLYASIDDGLRINLSSHRTFVSDGIDELRATTQEGQAFGFFDAPRATAGIEMAVEEAEMDAGGAGGQGARVRERFEDTAIFASLRTNDQGVATFTFRLPDNITSWRVTASGITNDLYAGNSIQNLQVTQPMFLHYTLNSTFLIGDIPYIGVNAYGTSLTGGEEVTFEVWREDRPDDIRQGVGVAFERVNIPLWEKSQEGFGNLIIQATVGEFQDAVQHSYQVVASHRQVETARFYEVDVDTVFEVPSQGLTNITFMDRGRGQFLSDLVGMRHIWRNGVRIEGFVAKREATALIERHFPETNLFSAPSSFDLMDYQKEDGGIAILPYGNSDLLTTVTLLPFIKNDVNMVAVREYLTNIYHTSTTENRVLALYGLAILGEPVLLDLQEFALLTDMSIRDRAYLALGLASFGEVLYARELYDQHIAPYIQFIAPYYRVNTGGSREEMLETTSIVAILAARLGQSESIGLHNYSMMHRRVDPIIQIERLQFIIYEMENYTEIAPTITYTLFGETITRELGYGGRFNLRIPAVSMGEFQLESITGEVSAVSIVRIPLEEMEAVENNIIIGRQFFLAGTNTSSTTFEQGDLIRVQMNINYSAQALRGSYMITDFLPAGLVVVPNSARVGDREGTPGWWTHVQTEGQRVTFFDFNGRFHNNNTYYFYARVVNPGTFFAEGTIVQSVGVREYMTVGEGVVVTINP